MSAVQRKLNDIAANAANQIAKDAKATEGEHGHIAETATTFLVNLEAAMFENGAEAEVEEMLLYVLRDIANRLMDGEWQGW